jgi:hypothetical protein
MHGRSGKDERRPERMAAIRGHQVLLDLDSGLRRCPCDRQVVCVHHHQAHCIDQETDEDYCLDPVSSHLVLFLGHIYWNTGILPAGALFV